MDALPLGVSSFSRLRITNRFYVDKTELVYGLASASNKLFLTRPRRFGKSLLISTFESLFKYGLRDFKGLAIEKLWKEDVSPYTVVRLDFSGLNGAKTKKEFSAMFGKAISRSFVGSGYEYEGTEPDDFDKWLKYQKDASVVLLIDEYDAPLTAVLDQPKLFEEFRDILANFYSFIKANDRVFRFVFITGITKFSNLNIFCQINDLDDISLKSKYGSLLGYTHQEVKDYFGTYLEEAAKTLNISKSELFQELVKHYNGFCFEKSATQQVFAPWSILNFFKYVSDGFEDYWFETGGRTTALLRFLKSHSLRRPEEYGKDKSLPLSMLSGSSDIEGVSDLVLLTQTGYLSIKDVKYGVAYLGYPNAEVQTAMANLYMELLLKGRVAGQVGAGPIVEVLVNESPGDLFLILNRLFGSIDYQNYPVRDEASVRGFAQVYLTGARLSPRIEQHSAHSRSDLEVKVGKRHWIMEFKVVTNPSEEEAKLHEALEQLRKYGKESNSPELFKVALVFSKEKREFVRWSRLS